MRDISPEGLAALRAGTAKAALLVHIELAAGPLYLTSASRSITWGGNTYVATGALGTVEAITDRVAEGERAVQQLMLSGIPQAVLVTVLGASVCGRPCTQYVAIFAPDTEAITDVLQLHAGELERASVVRTTGPDAGRAVAVTNQHLATRYAKPKPFRNTDADQRRAYGGDTSRRFLLAQAQHQDVWPAASWYKKQG